MDSCFQVRLNAVIDKYSHGFPGCDIVDLCKLDVEVPGDFLSCIEEPISYSTPLDVYRSGVNISSHSGSSLGSGTAMTLLDAAVLKVSQSVKRRLQYQLPRRKHSRCRISATGVHSASFASDARSSRDRTNAPMSRDKATASANTETQLECVQYTDSLRTSSSKRARIISWLSDPRIPVHLSERQSEPTIKKHCVSSCSLSPSKLRMPIYAPLNRFERVCGWLMEQKAFSTSEYF
ncbi:hypothetical protein CRM22_008564 [Opisthorchis felineus]|uniref:Uncharacterized protein n=1 Tax=Opisthorchis felineus TaxID=147828 RepID=A0A4S2LHN2_OPIFE|nr:hypothetical protein CRM22_008564 [Opisthorchis felineus]